MCAPVFSASDNLRLFSLIFIQYGKLPSSCEDHRQMLPLFFELIFGKSANLRNHAGNQLIVCYSRKKSFCRYFEFLTIVSIPLGIGDERSDDKINEEK